MSTEFEPHFTPHYDSALSAEQISAVVANAALEFTDVAERQGAITDQLTVLATRHDISGAIQDPMKALILVGLASNLAAAWEQGEESYAKQSECSDIATGLLLEDINPYDDGASDDEKFAAYLDYENPTLTRQLKEKIDSGLLDSIKLRMGITSENEVPYQVHVLDIANPESFFGINLDGEDRVFRKMLYDYKQGLEANMWELRSRINQTGPRPAAWVATHKDVPHVFMMNPGVEKILHPDVTLNAQDYNEHEARVDFAFLEHEYAHTQGSLLVDGNIGFGVGLEELRVEHFAGNYLGYQDIKSFFRTVSIISGLDVSKLFDAQPKGGTIEEIFTHTARRLGVGLAVDILMVAPESYCEVSGGMKAMNQALDGRNGVKHSIFTRVINEEGGDGAIMTRLIQVGAWQRMATTLSPDD